MTSRVRTPRVLMLAAAAALAGAPLLSGSPASAQPSGTVTFNGGCGVLGSGLGGSSTPDAAQLSVPVGTGVRFANRLGQPATLLIDGQSAGEVPAGGVADVVFEQGPVTASMQVSCMLGSPAGTVTVEVVQHARQEPPSEPSPSPSPSPAARPAPERPRAGSPAAAGAPSGGGARQVPDATGENASWPYAPGQPPPAGNPDNGPSRDDRDSRSIERRGRWKDDAEPADSSGLSGTPVTVDAEPADDTLGARSISRTAGSAPDGGPVGLLALIATVCVVGVSAGAIRTVVTQRANRAEWA